MAPARPWAAFALAAAGFVSVAAVVAAAILAGLTANAAHAANSNALWRVVHDLCVPDMKVSGAPAPCLAVDRARGFAVLKDLRGATQVLVIPTDRVTGIESTSLLAPGSPNYWQDAWEARRFIERRVRGEIPREDLALAVNSIFGRSQDQLHIHVDCVRRDVRDALMAHQSEIGLRWRTLDFPLAGRLYRARRVMGADLGAADPFKLLASGDWRARADMARETLAVVGVAFADGPGFVILSDRADLWRGDSGVGEDVMDHTCKVLARAPPAAAA